jgi:hypothetical protein
MSDTTEGTMSRPLGPVQRDVLAALVKHGSWPSAWVWDTTSGTVRVLDTLVKRGLAAHDPEAYGVHGLYTPTSKGREAATRGDTR